MATIQIVIEDQLLKAADRMAKKQQVNRSALIREALRAYLKRNYFRELERREREAYTRTPDDLAEVALWEGVADWPED
jgi:metal-responsive CopG/Arc/MetJ family transcriptional regulator